MRSVYIHIPFCKQKCYYCDFISYSNKEDYFDKYIQSLIEEMNNFFNDNIVEIATIYIGGGTPSLIDAKYIEKVISVFQEKSLLKNNNKVRSRVIYCLKFFGIRGRVSKSLKIKQRNWGLRLQIFKN